MTIPPNFGAAPTDGSPPNVDVGLWGETLVAHWLLAQGWSLLHQRWRSRWGELDLVAQQPSLPKQPQELRSPAPTLVFIEVKTRGQQNWDADGLLAITPQKQAKLWKTAELFLASEVRYANLPCRFDVALVSWQKVPLRSRSQPPTLSSQPLNLRLQSFLDLKEMPRPAIALGQPVIVGSHQLVLKDYLQDVLN